jgi:Cactus-binding C-terminus of cactin protein/Conserved mid region of cactin
MAKKSVFSNKHCNTKQQLKVVAIKVKNLASKELEMSKKRLLSASEEKPFVWIKKGVQEESVSAAEEARRVDERAAELAKVKRRRLNREQDRRLRESEAAAERRRQEAESASAQAEKTFSEKESEFLQDMERRRPPIRVQQLRHDVLDTLYCVAHVERIRFTGNGGNDSPFESAKCEEKERRGEGNCDGSMSMSTSALLRHLSEPSAWQLAERASDGGERASLLFALPPDPLDALIGALAKLDNVKKRLALWASIEDDAALAKFWQCVEHLCFQGQGKSSPSSINDEVRRDIEAMLDGQTIEQLDELHASLDAKISDDASPLGGAMDVDYWLELRARVAAKRATMFAEHIYGKALTLARATFGRCAPPTPRSTASSSSSSSRMDHSNAGDGDDDGGGEDTQGDSEEPLSDEAVLVTETRGVKPFYQTSVYKGYMWTHYNKLHFSVDSPPPKLVKGYRFAVALPKLKNRDALPTFTLEPDPSGSDEFVVLHFRFGEPYRHLAFRVVNREWETSQRLGFRCYIDSQLTFHLRFRYKRYRYRK